MHCPCPVESPPARGERSWQEEPSTKFLEGENAVHEPNWHCPCVHDVLRHAVPPATPMQLVTKGLAVEVEDLTVVRAVVVVEI